MRLLSALWVLLLPTVAFAEPKDDARRHFAGGLEAAQQGNYEVALQRFLAAQEAWPHPSTLYNIAKAYMDLGDVPNALVYFELYRDAVPEKAPDVDPIIAVLDARRTRASAPAPAVAPGRALAPSAGTPTSEELARLDAIAQELRALTETLQTRAVTPTEVAMPTPEDAAPAAPSAPVETGEAQTDFIDEAYERTVVTASRVGQDPLDSPSTVSVVTADDIRRSGALSVPDLLRMVVGMDVMSPSPGHSDIAIRGFQRKMNNKVLVLLDGRSLYIDFLGTTLWGIVPVELEEIDRIEVIRGPGSAVYGANAVTGVINIITRTPGEGPQVVSLNGGTPGIVRTAAVASGRAGATSYRLSAGTERHGVWAKTADLSGIESPAVNTWTENPNIALDTVRMNFRVDRQLTGKAAVSASGGYATTESEFYNVGALPRYGLTLHSHYLRGDVFVSNLHLRSFWYNVAGKVGPWIEYQGERGLDADLDSNVIDVEAELPIAADTGEIHHQFNVGGGWRNKNIRFGYLEGGFDQPWVEDHFQVFANEQATWRRLSLAGSLRVDAHPLIAVADTISPRGAILFRLFDKTTIRATAGSAYRAPSAIESYMDFDLQTPVDGVYIRDRGNRNLVPERIRTFELGVHDASSLYHQADVVVYMNRVTDLITLSDVTPAANPFDPTNVGISAGETGWINDPGTVYTGIGVEGELEVYPTDGLDLFANVSLMQITEDDGTTSGPDRSSSPFKLNLGATYRTPYQIDLSLFGSYLAAQDWKLREFDPTTLELVANEASIDARTMLTARVAVRPFAKEDLEVALTGWNLLQLFGDGFYEHPEGQPVTGRLFGSASWRF